MKFYRRFSFKISLIFGLLLILFLAAFFSLIGITVRQEFHEHASEHFQQYAELLARELGQNPNPEHIAALEKKFSVRLKIHHQGEHHEEDDDDHDHRPPLAIPHGHPPPHHHSAYNPAHSRPHRPMAVQQPLPNGDVLEVLWMSPKPWWVWNKTRLIFILILSALITAAYFASRYFLRPLSDITKGVQRFAQGDLSQPIPVTGHDELSLVVKKLNQMARDLSELFSQKTDMLLAVSHELRSPLARMRMEAELLPEDRTKTALIRDIAVLSQLIDTLLTSEKSDSPYAHSQRRLLSLQQVLLSLKRHYFAEAAVQWQLDPVPEIELDSARMELLLRNLISNALNHGKSDQAVEVYLRDTGQELHVQVRDFGPGVSAEELARLKQPFYRTDPARHRSTGGVGLGLYLSEKIARAHGGSLDIESAQPGLKVTLRLPYVGGSEKTPVAVFQ